MRSVKDINIADYTYPLTDDRIAKFPVTPRDASKLLVYRNGSIKDDIFRNVTSYLTPGSLMVCNNTKVIYARLHFRKATGALIEVFLLEPLSPSDYEQAFQCTKSCSWACLVGNLKKWKDGSLTREIDIDGARFTLTAEHIGIHGTSHEVRFSWNGDNASFADILDATGELPIPPYLNRKSVESDKTTYQTVYSKVKGSVAAPTAGLHFTDEVLCSIASAGIRREEVTLHVGAGTFRPVKSPTIEGHEMHTEFISVHRNTLDALLSHDCHATAVGTTTVRTLESLYYLGVRALHGADLVEDMHVTQWEPYEQNIETPAEDAIKALSDYMCKHGLDVLHANTQIIIVPGYKYKIVDTLITNFHQPRSTLLLLVSAFIGDDWHRVYDHALANGYRFLSYGDSSILKI